MNRPKTIFIDIDGVIFYHYGSLRKQILANKPKILKEVVNIFEEWDKKGHIIILTTGRKECSRKITEKQLENAGIFYDQLIMGISGGMRILINDSKPNSNLDTAYAYTLVRNAGLKKLKGKF